MNATDTPIVSIGMQSLKGAGYADVWLIRNHFLDIANGAKCECIADAFADGAMQITDWISGTTPSCCEEALWKSLFIFDPELQVPDQVIADFHGQVRDILGAQS